MESKAALPPSEDGKWAEMEPVFEHIHVVSEETLDRISRGSLGKFTLQCEDDQKVDRAFRSLLETFSEETTSQMHTAAASNALSAFLEAGLVSQNEKTRQLVLSSETWLAVFEVFLSRFEYTKPRPMKQVLLSLAKLLARQVEETQTIFIKRKIGDATIPSIVLGEPRSRLRASLVSWEIFIRKKIFSPGHLISIVRSWLFEHHEMWLPIFHEDCEALGIDDSQFKNQILRNSTIDNRLDDAVIKVLLQGLLTHSKNMDIASLTGAMIAALLQKIKTDLPVEYSSSNDSTFSLLWVTPVKRIMLQNLDALDTFSNYVLDRLFAVDPSGFKVFISQLPLKSLLTGDMSDAPPEEFVVLFAALQVGKKNGLVHEDHYLLKPGSSKKDAGEPFVLNSEIIGKFLLHREPSIRVAALSLLIMAPSTTKPLTPSAISAIINGLPTMHADPDPYYRGEILYLTRKLILRLKGGGVLKNLETPPAGTKTTVERSDQETQFYLKTYINSLSAELRPTASYQRHITALKALSLILESGLDSRVKIENPDKAEKDVRWKFSMDIFHPRLLRSLIDLLLDPFDDVRATSLSILNSCPQETLMKGLSEIEGQVTLTDALEKAENIASKTSRADHADTVARLYHILFTSAELGRLDEENGNWWSSKTGIVNTILTKVEQKLSLPGGLFNSSMRDAPLHGYLSGLRYIVMTPKFYSLICEQSSKTYSTWRSTHLRIQSICNKIWLEVKPVLCVDSPEGHTDEPVEDLAVGPKDILSYSWRALRESSLLLHATLANSAYGPRGETGLTRAEYENIGTASFIQLAELRHRGAFSTVSQTFATCCQRCSQSSDPTISSLPQGWYEEARKLIYATASKLTRRSAGLPALITGILLSNPGGPLFQRVMTELQEISRMPAKNDSSTQNIELPQVHAMNCLKDIFANNKLGPQTKPFIIPSLTLSVDRIGSPIWNLRNAGLMLFRALLGRMCRSISGSSFGFGGSSGSEPGARVSFQKYPDLPQLLSRLLAPSSKGTEIGDNASVTERVFPALELIGEKVPFPGDDTSVLRKLVLQQLNSPVWAIREHSARVYASLLSRSDILTEIQSLLDIERDQTAQNYLHGKSLCIRYALSRFASAPVVLWKGNIGKIMSTVRHSFAALFPSAKSPVVAASLIEVLNDVVEKSIASGEAGNITSLLEHVFEEYDFNGILDYLFNSSDPSWSSSSTTRASSLLRRALSWTVILRMFASNKLDELEPFLRSVSAFDPNAGRWLLERMPDLFGEDESHKGALLKLYSSVILSSSSDLVKATAILNLASILEAFLDFHHGITHFPDLPREDLERQIEPGTAVETWNREMTDAALRLQGCFLAAKAISHQWQSPSAEFELELQQWTIKLRCALQEETEFTTRHAAVASSSAFGRALRLPGSSARVDNVFLDIYLILYDMLNDDDEELRDMAAATASWVLSYSSINHSKAVSLAPLNASELLAEFITTNYSTSQILCGKIFHYILGQVPRVSDRLGKVNLTPVSDLISEYRKESTVLFVEEKQNLFIDDVREAELWSKSIHLLAEASYNDGRTLNEVSTWVSEGLAYLSAITADGAGKDGPLGWTSKPEIFTLGVRVISIAGALVSPRFSAQKLLGYDYQRTLKEKLQLLQRHGLAASMNGDWLLRIQAALENS